MCKKIAELSFPTDFNGVLKWGFIDNRPYLRCLQGYGLSLWRLGNFKEARYIFNRLLWLNPTDNKGIRFIIPEVEAGIEWRDDV